MKKILLVVFILALSSVIAWFTVPNLDIPTVSSDLPVLYTSGNGVFRSDTREQVILRGAVSDYFRYGNHNQTVHQEGLETELARVKTINKMGANLIGLYLADIISIKENINELDAYVTFASENKMYVYLIPVAREFNDAYDEADTSRNGTFEDLQSLIDLLSSRYAKDTHVLYGFGAEPHEKDLDSWKAKQIVLTQIVRRNATQALILITGIRSVGSVASYLQDPFPSQNVIYFGGGYTSANDISANEHPTVVQGRIAPVWEEALSKKFPYLAGEFGGHTASDFSSDIDLAIIKKMFAGLIQHKTHYTMYKLSSNFRGYGINPSSTEDGLSLFDFQGNLTKRGQVFFEALQQSPPTQF
jgi:hypothetical protein